ncbi:MAG: VanZ family protein [Bacteroidales bacterium]|jgi:VanZ family protein|nr:VanZ family protein [Bacteroidales bacterium]
MRSSIRYIILPALVALVIFYVTCIVNVDSIPVPKKVLHYDKLAHFLMFFTLSAAIYFDYYWLHKRKPNKYRLLFFGLIIPVIYGGLIEIVQEHFFSRSGDWYDFYADALGSLTATVILFIFIRMRRKQ